MVIEHHKPEPQAAFCSTTAQPRPWVVERLRKFGSGIYAGLKALVIPRLDKHRTNEASGFSNDRKDMTERTCNAQAPDDRNWLAI
jgi:hypothetical protein